MPKIYKIILLTLSIISVIGLSPAQAHAETVDDLKAQIEKRNAEKAKLEAEIVKYRQQIAETRVKSKSLTGEIKVIDLERKKLSTDIAVTSNKISSAQLKIQALSYDIQSKAERIKQNETSIAELLRKIKYEETDNLFYVAVASVSLSDFIAKESKLSALNKALLKKINELRGVKQNLESSKTQKETEKSNLSGLKVQLADQKAVVDETKKEKDSLLSATKSKEANYQKLLADRLKKKQEVEAEIENIEAKIKITLDPSLLPKVAKGILSWPTASRLITQYFGNTAFASAHKAVYNGKGHNGLDIGIGMGTPIMSAGDGVVAGTGNTDTTCAGASYGKWILVKHDNGLSSLYAHLSVIKVTAGQRVTRGETIALSGNTGYSTGPHLHFTVYASQGVKIDSLQSKVKGCGVYTMPIASYNSYLNPLAYL